jgi:predicted MPP superfamily phosphohydrolase
MRVLLAITAAMQVPFGIGAAEAARRLGLPSPWAIGGGLALLSIVLFGGRVRAGMPDRRRGSALSLKLVDIPYYVHWCACVFTIVPSIVGSIALPVVDLVRGLPPSIPAAFFMWTYVMGLVVCGYGILVRRRWFLVREVEVVIAGLDPSFDGFRIAHLSDLHIGTNTPKSWGHRWARAANGRKADIAVVTGDLVSSGSDYHGDIAEVVGGLEAKDGVFVSMGNHDYFGEGEPLVSLLAQRGVRVLRNEGVLLEREGKPVYLAGIDDTWTRRDDLDRALRERPDAATTILLSHDPERFTQAAARDVALTLSGHTHGGQIAFPFLSRWVSLSHLTHSFHQGLYKKGDATLYVHPGLGTTGPPMRLGVAPAVVILTLRAAGRARKSAAGP